MRRSSTARARAAVVSVLLLLASAACQVDANSIVLGATTSTHDSGLLEHLISRFRDDHPHLRVRTVIVGSGEALALGRRGDVDLLLVHAPEAERRFVAGGHAPARRPVMYNRFVIAGPPDDPAGVRGAASAREAFARIAAGGHRFVSRGDSSGTHHRELSLWREAGEMVGGDMVGGGPGIDDGPGDGEMVGGGIVDGEMVGGGPGVGGRPGGGWPGVWRAGGSSRAGRDATAPAWYVETGQGQTTTLHVASERAAYALTDEATFALLTGILELDALVTGDPALLNVYSVLSPARARRPEAAAVFADWLRSEPGRRAIIGLRIDDTPLFVPWADSAGVTGRRAPGSGAGASGSGAGASGSGAGASGSSAGAPGSSAGASGSHGGAGTVTRTASGGDDTDGGEPGSRGGGGTNGHPARASPVGAPSAGASSVGALSGGGSAFPGGAAVTNLLAVTGFRSWIRC